MLRFYACAVTCGHSFTVLSVWGILISFLGVFSVFSHPPLPFIFITVPCYYYYYCCCYCYWLLLLLLFPRSSWLCVTGAWGGAGYGLQGLWLVAGRAGFCGALTTWDGVGSSSPHVPGHPTFMCDAGINCHDNFLAPVIGYFRKHS